MTSLGADYSWARPGGAALAAAGVKAVGRYLASDGRGITAAEYQDLTAHGIGVWLVREGAANGMLGGFAKGVADAQIAVQQIAAVGLPADSLVYAAADWDVQDSQFPACDDYMRGFASVLGANRTGIYAGLHYMNHAHAMRLAVGFWQAGATSWNHGEAAQMPVQFIQTTKTPPLPGTDHNYINDLTTLAGAGAVTPITETDDDEMISTDSQAWLKSLVLREARGRLYYCATPPAGLPNFVCIFWHRNPGDRNILYANGGQAQADHWNTLYSQTADTTAQAMAAALSPQQFATLVGLAQGTDSAFTAPKS